MTPNNGFVYLTSAVPNRPFIDVGYFPELKPLLDNWHIIRQEALNCLMMVIFVLQANIRTWHSARFSKTVEIVENINSLNAVMFAKLPQKDDWVPTLFLSLDRCAFILV